MENINNLRQKIDQIDADIINLLGKRFEIVKEVWEIKKSNNMPALQPARWQEVLSSRISLWEEVWLKKDMIETIWNEIHDYALDIES